MISNIDFVIAQKVDTSFPKEEIDTYLGSLLSPSPNEKTYSYPKNRLYSDNLLLIKGLVEIKKGNYWRAYWDLKKSYQSSIKKIENDSTDIISKLNAAIISIAISEVPNEYHWLRNFLGFSPLDYTLQEKYILEAKKNASEFISLQAYLTEILKTSFLLKDREQSFQLAEEIKKKFPDNKYVKVALGWIYIKIHYPELSIQELIDLPADIKWFGYYNYVLGTAYYYAEEYQNANIHFNTYLHHYSTDYVKDIYYKKLIMDWFSKENKSFNEDLKDSVLNEGGTYMNLDRYALNFVSNPPYPNQWITKSRILFDGGKYDRSIEVLLQVTIDTLPQVDKLEYYYRLGRSNQALNDTTLAIKCYLEVLKFEGDKPKVYYPANAALNLGILYEGLNDKHNAVRYYQKALNYPKHPYKNSIDAESKRRLNTLNASK
ncbi:tetratricopeptide repeat protein [Flammeovirga sp. MY04]|uniref:tetratricopeptide repeat protein n=1 Tax=Flammeovirga sp. MY04 TaxID=1191459 RepID=UPI0008062D85|nr:tetratricopeptide repeat protein [Flammeovirga sp. MY04]ANQ48559.1 tetratricopeptide repeat protein [Flammeovirga sp. MY04]